MNPDYAARKFTEYAMQGAGNWMKQVKAKNSRLIGDSHRNHLVS